MRYTKSDIRSNINGIKYFKSKLFPIVPYSETDIYIITTIGDRLDLLADTYYKDVENWWIIYMANNNITKASIFVQSGIQIRIPINIVDILKEYNRLNLIK